MRSSQLDVRNPLLSLPAAQKITSLPPEAQAALSELLKELATDAADRAEKSWRKSKGPMAAYWKAVSVYAKHVRKLCRATAPADYPATRAGVFQRDTDRPALRKIHEAEAA